jgi:hypothetical protein
MTGVELFLGGIAALAVLSLVVKAQARVKRARLAAEITRAGTRPASLLGPVLVTALVIIGVQWFVITQVADRVWWWVALGFPALVTAHTLTKAFTVMQIGSAPGRRGGGRR